MGHLIESFDMASAKAGPGVGIVEDVDLHSQHLLLDIISPISFDYNFNLLDKSRTVITGEGKFEANPMLEAYHRSAEIMGQVFHHSSAAVEARGEVWHRPVAGADRRTTRWREWATTS